ncbi:MAG TPA: hypothetical protein VGI10_20845 [Polyangiaceae bacterium]|jgi:hypothetical protein
MSLLSTLWRSLRGRWPDWAFLALGGALLAFVCWEACCVRVITHSPNADYWEHAAVLRALMQSLLHPGNPQLVSGATSARYGPQFVLVALLARAAHTDALGAMSIAAMLDVVLLLLGIYVFFRRYFDEPIASVYGLLVMLTSWWVGFRFSNVYQLTVLPSVASYPSSTALALCLLGLALELGVLRRRVRKPLGLCLLGLCQAMTFIVHPLTAMIFIAGSGLLCVSEPHVERRLRFEVLGASAAGLALSHFWPYFSPWRVLLGGSGFSAHWLERSVQAATTRSLADYRHTFYDLPAVLRLLGLSFLGLLALPYFFLRRARWFVGFGALLMLVPYAVNARIEIPLGHRFLLLAIFYLQVACVWLLLCLTPGSRLGSTRLARGVPRVLGILAIATLLTPFVIHNVWLANHEISPFSRRAKNGPTPIVRYARAAAEIAGPGAVVLADPVVSWPLPAFGLKVLVLNHDNPFVADEPERDWAVSRFLSDASPQEREQIIERYQVTHVVLRREPRGSLRDFLANSPRQPLPAGYILFALPSRPRQPYRP